MKRVFLIMIVSAATLFAGCSVAPRTGSSATAFDDLYGVHDRGSLAVQERKEADAQRAREQRRLDKIAEAEDVVQQLASQEYDENLVADTYESAYERRLRGFSSPTYQTPSNYYQYRYSGEYDKTIKYDPSAYNIIVMGDEVWVEPKHITSMFGTWGSPSFNFGWNSRWGSSWSIGWSYWDYYDYWTYNPWLVPSVAYGWAYPWSYWNSWYYTGWGWYGPHCPSHHWGGGWGHHPPNGWGWNYPTYRRDKPMTAGGTYAPSGTTTSRPAGTASTNGGGTYYRDKLNGTGTYSRRPATAGAYVRNGAAGTIPTINGRLPVQSGATTIYSRDRYGAATGTYATPANASGSLSGSGIGSSGGVSQDSYSRQPASAGTTKRQGAASNSNSSGSIGSVSRDSGNSSSGTSTQRSSGSSSPSLGSSGSSSSSSGSSGRSSGGGSGSGGSSSGSVGRTSR